MQHNLSDEQVLVENLQKMLREIAIITGDRNYEVGVSGTYGEGTANAVRYFQQMHGLPVTGIVNLDTWVAIADEDKRLGIYGKPPISISPFPNDRAYTVKNGERSHLVSIIQIMLCSLSLIYDFEHIPVNGYFDTVTCNAVKKFQQMNEMSCVMGEVDRSTWNMLAEEYNNTVNC